MAEVVELPPATIALRLVIAALMGALVGWDRERHEKPAGLRTHMLVTLGSASFALLGFEVASRTNDPIDPTRVLQGIVGGIGFLGAGSIIKGHDHVKGVTTAASVWVCGALGAAAGMGAYVVAGISVLLTFVTLVLMGRLEPRVPKSPDVDRSR